MCRSVCALLQCVSTYLSVELVFGVECLVIGVDSNLISYYNVVSCYMQRHRLFSICRNSSTVHSDWEVFSLVIHTIWGISQFAYIFCCALSVCLSVCLCLSLSLCLSVSLSLSLSLSLPSLPPSVPLSPSLSSLPFSLSVSASLCLCLCLSLSLSLSVSESLSLFLPPSLPLSE